MENSNIMLARNAYQEAQTFFEAIWLCSMYILLFCI